MRRTLALIAVMAATAVAASAAAAAAFISLQTHHVHVGGRIRIIGDARHMPLYALPIRKLPCVKHGTCTGQPIHRATAPGRPFILLGRAPGKASGLTRIRAFTLRLPRALQAGRYAVFVWCAQCGDSLIVAAINPTGKPQTLDVLP